MAVSERCEAVVLVCGGSRASGRRCQPSIPQTTRTRCASVGPYRIRWRTSAVSPSRSGLVRESHGRLDVHDSRCSRAVYRVCSAPVPDAGDWIAIVPCNDHEAILQWVARGNLEGKGKGRVVALHGGTHRGPPGSGRGPRWSDRKWHEAAASEPPDEVDSSRLRQVITQGHPTEARRETRVLR